jgi:hypothetical protein
LYNPFSILNLVKQQRFANFWWETGTPTFLIKKLRTEFQYNLNDLAAGQVMFESFTINDLNLSFSAIGLFVQSEVSTAKGQVDTVVHTQDRIYVMEFKLDASAQSALAQIRAFVRHNLPDYSGRSREKRYGSPFLDQGKEVIALGVSFSSKEKAVAEWEAAPYLSLLVEG